MGALVLRLSLSACAVLCAVSCTAGVKKESRGPYTLVLAPIDSVFVGYRLALFTSSTGSVVPVISAEDQDTSKAASSSAYERLQEGKSYRLELRKARTLPRTYMWSPGQWPGRLFAVDYIVPHSADTASLMLLREDSLLVTLYESPAIVGPFVRTK